MLFSFKANQLDSVIAGVEANVKDSCVTSRAFRIRVALVEKLKDTSSKSMTGTPELVQHSLYSFIEWNGIHLYIQVAKQTLSSGQQYGFLNMCFLSVVYLFEIMV